MTVRLGDREEQRCQVIEGTASPREEAAHQWGKSGGRLAAEAALNEQAATLAKPPCCGQPMRQRDYRPVRVKGWDGEWVIRRRRCRCGHCGRTVYAADGIQQCGRHRVTRPLAKRVCQLATVEHFTQMPQLLFDQHGVRMSHEEIIELVHDVGTQVDRLRLAEAEVWLASGRRTWPVAKRTPPRVYVSCDGIMDCTNLREPDPHDPPKRRLLWPQMKVGCVDWPDEQEHWHQRMIWGRESPEAFGVSLYRPACEGGYREAAEKIFAADGGEWCWDIHRRDFRDATGILDWYHASEHVWETARILCPGQPEAATAWVDQAQAVLGEEGGPGLVQWLKPQRASTRRQKRRALDKLFGYVSKLFGYVSLHTPLMHYPADRRRG